MSTPKVSIIIPVYNVEKYLRRCIDSILNQSFKDYEILLIDDGSKDNSGKICDEYSKIDSRIKVFHKENGGVSSARNLGIHKALGEWIYFCDSDDETLYDGIENLLTKTGDVDFVMYGYYINGIDSSNIIINEIISTKVALIRLFKSPDKKYQGYLWSKLFKNSIIKKNNLKFNSNIRYNEDRLFIFEYLLLLNSKVFYSSIPVYNYYTNEDGAMSLIHKGKYLDYISDLTAFKKMSDLASYIDNRSLSSIVLISLFDSYFTNRKLIKKYSHNYKEELKILNREIQDISFSTKLKYWLKIKMRAFKSMINSLHVIR